MKPKDIKHKVLPRLVPLWIAGIVGVALLGGLIWSALGELLPESWGAWTDVRFMFGYALLLTAAPILLSDLWILLARDRKANNAVETEPWVRAGYDAVNDEMPYQQPISEAEKKTGTLRDYFSSQLVLRWHVWYVLAVAAAVISLVASVAFLRGGSSLADFGKPVFVTGCLSVFVIVLGAFCQICNHRLWSTWERQVMALQAENPRYEYRDSGEAEQAELDDDVEEEAPAPKPELPPNGWGDDFDPNKPVAPPDAPGWGATPATPTTGTPAGGAAATNGWAQPPEDESPKSGWGEASPGDTSPRDTGGGWGQSDGGYNV